MAIQQIETGYKPEFGLGAVYQGFNAANADQSSELELIKQFLANQREQQNQPIDLATKQQTFDINNFKTDPRYQQGMLDQTEGQGMTMLASGQNAKTLQPFELAAKRGALENEAGQNRNQAQIQSIDDALSGVDDKGEPVKYGPGVKEQLLQIRGNLVNRFKETPMFAGKRELRETGTESSEYIAELRAKQLAEAARLRMSGGDKPPKTAEEGAVRKLATQLAQGLITDEQYMIELANIFNAKNAAKIQPGTTLATDQLPTGTPLKEKPQQQQYVPSVSTPSVDLKSKVEKAGGTYEPDKYEYAEINGEIKRRLKGK